MAEFNLERFKYNWKGVWSPNTSYNRDDVITYGAVSYVCLETHTSSPEFDTDFDRIIPGSEPPQPDPIWAVMTKAKRFVGNWATATRYAEGDTVKINGSLWVCVNGHTSAAFQDNQADWELFLDGISFAKNFTGGTQYGKGALVKYNGIVYKCINAHTSQLFLENNSADWEEYHVGVEFAGNWNPNAIIRKNDLVVFGGTILKCTESHTSSTILDNTKFSVEIPGFNNAGNWQPETDYVLGDIVLYGGNLYFAVENSYNLAPSIDTGSAIYWLKIIDGYNFRGEYSNLLEYKPGDVVLRGGNLYRALSDVGISQTLPDGSTIIGDGSSLDYDDETLWELEVPGNAWKGVWQPSTYDETDLSLITVPNYYRKGDIVYYQGTAYEANVEHIATKTNFPGDNGNGFYLWDTFIKGNEAGLAQDGDLLTYNLKREAAGDGSTLGLTRVPIGETAQYLSVDGDQNVVWRNLFPTSTQLVYVATNGIDAPGRGLNPTVPFKTIRYACQYVEDNFTGPSKVLAQTGTYNEIGPIVIPEHTALMGDELRSTTVDVLGPDEYFENDLPYLKNILGRFDQLIPDLFQQNSITNTEGNEVQPVTSQTDEDGNETPFTPATVQEEIFFQALLVELRDYLDFRLSDGAVDPTLVGTNALTNNQDRLNATTIITANLEFLQAEANAWVRFANPGVETFNVEKINNVVREFVRSVVYDFRYPGNYKTLKSFGDFYKNLAIGGKKDNLFLVRDATGIRNMTLTGLEGALNPPGVFDLYQRPTGGAFVSLDPGWGPADERCWITTRSPYIQGVTTIGSNCVGQKVDGALHNGGNKSIVSNDFTQVLSDGIGAWITNNARAELVSVFTYYCAIGYLAENGGRMRATNGNNSYGRYGAIADGIDQSEVPRSAIVNNRTAEAQVTSSFIGENGAVTHFEYSNAGINYSAASATVTGAGTGVDLNFEDFRDQALFEARIINPPDSGSSGGRGYFVASGNAQTGDSTSITLSGTSDFTVEELIGKRIVIVGGVGVGQYGKISGYDIVTKVATIIKETDDTAGWNHWIEGSDIETTLQANTQYRIEPRITCSSPPFGTNFVNLPSQRDWTDLEFGQNTTVYNAVAISTGNGETIDIFPEAATFNISKTNGEYTVTIANRGAGYDAGEVFIITGDNLGGSTPENDLTITVSSTSEDSTNQIQSFTYDGVAQTGIWVAVSSTAFTMYSEDNSNWFETSLPSAGLWHKLATGNGRFVAIKQENSNEAVYSLDGKSWTTSTLPSSATWKDIQFGNGVFVAISDTSNDTAVSADGITWSAGTIPANALDDSVGHQWQALTYGAGNFIAVSGNIQSRAIAKSEDGITWTVTTGVLPVGDWVDVAYGKNKIVALTKSENAVAVSVDNGANFTYYTIPSLDDSTTLNWVQMKYAQGVFFAICNLQGVERIGDDAVTTNQTEFAITSEDGINWTVRDLGNTLTWKTIGFGNLSKTPKWIALASDFDAAPLIQLGATAIVRGNVIGGGQFSNVNIIDPGSGYTDLDPPVITVNSDDGFTVDLFLENRVGTGVLAQPSFNNRGFGFRSSTTRVSISGNGVADIIPIGNTITLEGLSVYPSPGAQLLFPNILDVDTPDPTDLKIYSAVAITPLGADANGALSATVEISPSLTLDEKLVHNTTVSIRENYSQCRITGHDFLDIGTGNFLETNYPEIYAGGNFFTASPENEVYEEEGGRVFYTASDQDGNFRAGELFAVEQATGIVTISAEFFDLGGLSELALGGVRLGGSGTVVREFSTDPTFAQDSNNVVPTQRAIARFLAARLSEGGSEIETNKLQAGIVIVGTDQNVIDVVSGAVLFPRQMNFEGNELDTAISGMIIAQNMFLRSDDAPTF